VTSQAPEDATECPRCSATLQPAAGGTGLLCPSCRGAFVFRAAIDAVLAESAALGGAVSYRQAARPTSPDAPRGSGAYEPAFRYLQCPRCKRTMNRQNFLKRSGVIVDTCLHHGTWFDDDEARRAGEYVAAGGKEPLEAEEREAKASARAGLPTGAQVLLEALAKLPRLTSGPDD